MSAAATAAGYLYASGRLRGRNGREDEAHEPEQRARPKRKELKVAVGDKVNEGTLILRLDPVEASGAADKPGLRASFHVRM